ncbi:GLPGLI family protein [Chryseobacterium oranimense]|uniref:GLPGLI family protein n=1 Tax=Chryseobacterium oranimense TaxID=421058 RepID=UPI0031E3CB9C
MYYSKKLFLLSLLFFSGIFFSKTYDNDSLRGSFTYLLKAKLNTQTPDYIHEELFSLLIGDNHAFFVSSKSLTRDSIIEKSRVTTNNPDGSITLGLKNGVSIPSTKFPYTIIQANQNIQYFQLVGMSILSYKEQMIGDWKLVNETKVINTINCKKAEVTFKGRNWIAWYSPKIPFPYGPYKFSGLPGLIVKITDDKGDFDFELVKSIPASKLKGKFITIKKSRYTEAIETTQQKLEQSLKVSRENAAAMLASYGTTIIKGQEELRQRVKEREEALKYENPIELNKD